MDRTIQVFAAPDGPVLRRYMQGTRVQGVWRPGTVTETDLTGKAAVWPRAGREDRENPPGPSRITDSISLALTEPAGPGDNIPTPEQADEIEWSGVVWTIDSVRQWTPPQGRGGAFWIATAVRKDDQP